MPRLLWKGSVNFGLIHAPVALYSASRKDEINLDLLDKRTMDAVGYQRINKVSGEPIDSENIVKGYLYDEGQYALLSDQEIQAISNHSAHGIDILSFVAPRDIPGLYYETPYYLTPAPGGEKTYALLRESLQRVKKVGIARVLIQTKQHLAAITAFGPALVLNTLRWSSEVRPFDELSFPDENPYACGVSDKELAMMEQLIANMTQAWRPAAYRNTVHDDLLALIKRKIRVGNAEPAPESPEIVVPEAARTSQDLSELLRRSLQQKAHSPARQRASNHPPKKGDGDTGRAKPRRPTH